LARIKQGHTAQTLLRAAGNPGSAEETLLRAAHGVSEAKPQHLLRACPPNI
jgi:hypothetical protein